MANVTTNRNQEPRILPCTCNHPHQDEFHGGGKRVHNFSPKHNNQAGGYRCTVCKNMKAK